jgi:hypothetical protein
MRFKVKLSTDIAMTLMREQVRLSETTQIDANWRMRIEKLSTLCAEGVSSTHIAFLGTAILAKSVNAEVDLFAIKPKHAIGNANAYSARSLCHTVLVPLAAEFGISIGVTGREPLNNQPYFRMTRLGDGTPVHAGGRAAFDYMVELVQELQAMPHVNNASVALQAFIVVRRGFQPRYTIGSGIVTVTPETLELNITRLVTDNSERGRRAQAVVAGLFDIFAGVERVESGRINDPSRNYPGDVCVRSLDGRIWEKAVEVRDKPVKQSDVLIFCKKCVEMGVREAAVVMVAPAQAQLDNSALSRWAEEFGIGLTLFYGWSSLVDQVLFWSPMSKPEAAISAVEKIEARLVIVEASPEAVAMWQSLVRA